jgi:hypothetical protein
VVNVYLSNSLHFVMRNESPFDHDFIVLDQSLFAQYILLICVCLHIIFIVDMCLFAHDLYC